MTLLIIHALSPVRAIDEWEEGGEEREHADSAHFISHEWAGASERDTVDEGGDLPTPGGFKNSKTTENGNLAPVWIAPRSSSCANCHRHLPSWSCNISTLKTGLHENRKLGIYPIDRSSGSPSNPLPLSFSSSSPSRIGDPEMRNLNSGQLIFHFWSLYTKWPDFPFCWKMGDNFKFELPGTRPDAIWASSCCWMSGLGAPPWSAARKLRLKGERPKLPRPGIKFRLLFFSSHQSCLQFWTRRNNVFTYCSRIWYALRSTLVPANFFLVPPKSLCPNIPAPIGAID